MIKTALTQKWSYLRRPGFVFLVLCGLVVGFLSGSLKADALNVTEFQITDSDAYETTPTLGNDGITDLVVFTSRELLHTGFFDEGDIWYQRLRDDGAPHGDPVQVTSDLTDDQLNDVSGDYIVYTTYESVDASSGVIMLYQISTGIPQPIGDSLVIHEPRIHGNTVVWVQGGLGASEVMIYDLAWLGTTRTAESLTGTVPPTSTVDIGDRFVVWVERDGDLDIGGYDLIENYRYRLTNTPGIDERYPSTSGDWVVWESQDIGASGKRIEAVNVETGDYRVVLDDGSAASLPSMDGDLIAYETKYDVDLWTNIQQVAAGHLHTVGVKTDGTVVAVGWNRMGVYGHRQCDVDLWSGIQQVAAGTEHTVGVKTDGTVVAVGWNFYGQCDVGSWSGIQQVAAGGDDTVGVKTDGTVVAVGGNFYGQRNVGSWTNIQQVAAAAGGRHTVGVKTNGTVVAVGWNYYGQCDVGSWTDIQQVAAGACHTVGVKTDGTVVAVGYNNHGQRDVGLWTNIQQVAAGWHHTVGLKTDGTVVAVGYNLYGQCDVGSWSGVQQVAAGTEHTVGVKTDGTAVAVGSNEYGQCDVGKWYRQYDVYLYRISTEETFTVTTDPNDQYLNDIFGDLIAYADTRNGNEDIYVAKLTLIVPFIIYVDADATGANNGTSWANAYNYLQDALAFANAHPGNVNQIWVAEGTYEPDANSANPDGTGDQTATFQLINGVAIRGGYAGCGKPDPNYRDISFYKTILSGDLEGNDVDVNDPCDLPNEPTRAENSYNVVTGSRTDANAILDGFAITAGWADIEGNRGGGMYNFTGSPTVTNCTFSGNKAWHGGGMYNGYGSPAVSNCTFTENWAGAGGGMYNSSCSPMLTNCNFIDNSADSDGGGMHNLWYSNPTLTNCTFSGNKGWAGGGMHNEGYCNPAVTNCTFSGNSAEWGGGGMRNLRHSNPTLTNCTFCGNSAGYYGGGMGSEDSSPMVTNCTFSGNSAVGNGGAMYMCAASPTMTNCTFSGNSAPEGSALACNCSYPSTHSSTVQLANCILWDGGNEIWNNDGSTITITYSDVQGGWAGPGGNNITSDPCFVRDPCDGGDGWGVGDNDDFGDLHLMPGSPCIDAGDNNAVPAGITTDIDGDPRFVDDPCTTDTGNGSPPIVDMGSDELLRASETVNQGQTVTINPGGGSGVPTEDALVVFENKSTSTANVTVTQMASDLHPEQKSFSLMGTTLIIDTTLEAGQFLMTVVIPFTAADLDGADWQLLDLKYWDGSTWVTAGTGPRDVNTPPSPPLENLKGRGLGAYGVYWNSTDGEGFVWANVNHTTDFTAALLPGDFEPDSDVDMVDYAWFAERWLDANCGSCGGADLTSDGKVDWYDLKKFSDNWLIGK